VPVRYRSGEEDSARWDGFRFRDGDIVISTRSKHGTTWMQMICALLVLGTPELPAPLPELSPWLDWTVRPLDQVLAGLQAQRHRRFVKTHTPLDGIPLDPRAHYVVVARHPLDAAVSLYHQGANIDRDRVAELTGQPAQERPPRPPVAQWLADWSLRDDPAAEFLDEPPGVLHHLADAWARRDQPNVVLVHYDDLLDDLAGSMRALAVRLGLPVPQGRWPELVRAAGFAGMRRRSAELAPGTGVLKDPAAFFRGGRSGEGSRLLTPEQLTGYHAHAARLAPADLLSWLHRGR
jgi:aryl sulfotransferase